MSEYMDPDLAEFEGTIDDDLFSAMRVLSAKRKMVEANAARAQAEVDKIMAWESRVNEKMRLDIQEILEWIEHRASWERVETGQKTFSTPWGTVRTTPRRPRVIVENMEEFLAWGREHEAVKVTESPIASRLSALVFDEGMEVPGTTVAEPERPFNVSISTEE